MRPSSFEISSDPWDAAVQQWLVYLSNADRCECVCNGSSRLLQTPCRRCSEYANVHRSMRRAQSILINSLKKRGSSLSMRSSVGFYWRKTFLIFRMRLLQLKPEYDRALIECPDLGTKRKPRTMKYILNAITGSDRFYYLGYGAASEIVHGSAHGMEQLFRQTEGGAISGRIEYEPSEFNHDLVQLAGYTISFSEIYVKRFNQPLQGALNELTTRYEALAQRYAAPSTVGE